MVVGGYIAHGRISKSELKTMHILTIISLKSRDLSLVLGENNCSGKYSIAINDILSGKVSKEHSTRTFKSHYHLTGRPNLDIL